MQVYTLAYTSPTAALLAKYKPEGEKAVLRPYTPTSDEGMTCTFPENHQSHPLTILS